MKNYLSYHIVWDAELRTLLDEAHLKIQMAQARASVYSSDRAEQLREIAARTEELLVELESATAGRVPPYHALPSLN